jgi:hypothetical protein
MGLSCNRVRALVEALIYDPTARPISGDLHDYSIGAGTGEMLWVNAARFRVRLDCGVYRDEQQNRVETRLFQISDEHNAFNHGAFADPNMAAKGIQLALKFLFRLSFEVQGNRFLDVQRELVQRRGRGDLWKIQALSHILLLTTKHAHLDRSLDGRSYMYCIALATCGSTFH